MKAIRYNFKKSSELEIADVSPPVVGSDEVRIRVAYSGICGSDIARYRLLTLSPKDLANQLGTISPTIGHEFSGIIDQVGNNVSTNWNDNVPLIGSRVIVHPILGCDQCNPCQTGYWSACETPGKMKLMGLHRHGGMANFVSVPINHVVRVTDDNLPLEIATLSEPLAVAIRAIEALPMSGFNKPVAVIGDGPIGILAAHLLNQQGYQNVLLVGRHQNRLDVAKMMGVDNLKLSKDVTSELHNQYQFVIQLAGSQEALQTGVQLLSRGGIMVCLGYLHKGDPGLSPDLFFQVIHKEKTIKGSHSYSFSQFKHALSLISSGEVDVAPLISAIIPLDEIIIKGFEPLISQNKPSGKILVKLD